MKGTTGASKHEGRAAVRHGKVPEPELNTEDAAGRGTEASKKSKQQEISLRLLPEASSRAEEAGAKGTAEMAGHR